VKVGERRQARGNSAELRCRTEREKEKYGIRKTPREL